MYLLLKYNVLFEINPAIALTVSQVQNLCDWNGDGKNHFRLKSRYTFEKLIRKVGYETVKNAAPKEQRKFIVYTHKIAERKKKQRNEEYKMYKVCLSSHLCPSI